MQNAEVYTHNDYKDLSFFEPLVVERAPVFDSERNLIANASCLKYSSDGSLAFDKCVSNTYSLQNHVDLFYDHNKILETSSLDLNNITVRDEYTNGGRKAKRSLFFNDHKVNVGKGDPLTMRCDMINSVDTTGAFQMFAGAYRSLCENSMVFGGEKAFYTKRKHTQHFDRSNLLRTANSVFTTFGENVGRFQDWKNTRVVNYEAAQIIRHFLSQDMLSKKRIDRALMSGELSSNSRIRNDQINEKISTLNNKPFQAMMDLWEMYSSEYGSSHGQGVGKNKWALFNVFTHWATHTHDSREVWNKKGEFKIHSFGRKNKNQLESKFGSYTLEEQERRSEKLLFLFQIPRFNRLGQKPFQTIGA